MTGGKEGSTGRAVLAGGRALQGWRCAACGATSFPIVEGCVVCGSLAGAAVDLAPSGTVEALTIVGPRIVCEVRLDGGPLVLGWLDGKEPAAIGMRVAFAPNDDGLRFIVHEG